MDASEWNETRLMMLSGAGRAYEVNSGKEEGRGREVEFIEKRGL